MALGVREDSLGSDGVREGMRGIGVLNAAVRSWELSSDSCRGGWWGTRCLGAHGGGRPVLLNHLSQSFDKAEVSPNGEEALCSEAEENLFIPLPRPV